MNINCLHNNVFYVAGPCTSSTGKAADGEGGGEGGSGEGGSGEGGSGEGVSGEGVSGEGGTGEGVASESDEEYQIGGSESDGGPSDDEGNEGTYVTSRPHDG